MSVRNRISRLEAKGSPGTPGPPGRLLTCAEVTALLVRMGKRPRAELEAILASGDVDLSGMSHSQLWRVARGEPVESVTGCNTPGRTPDAC